MSTCPEPATPAIGFAPASPLQPAWQSAGTQLAPQPLERAASRPIGAPLQRALQALAATRGGLLVAFDTSTACTSLVVVDAQQGIQERTWWAPSRPCEVLLAGLLAVLQEIGRAASDIKALLVGVGPGSFTGLRVGLATAKGLALGGDLALYAASSLQMAAVEAGPGTVLALQDARRGEVFAGLYHVMPSATGEVVRGLLPDAAWAPEALRQALRAILAQQKISAKDVRITGNVQAAAGDTLQATVDGIMPRAIWGLAACLPEMIAGRSVDVSALVPQYLRLSEPERRRLCSGLASF